MAGNRCDWQARLYAYRACVTTPACPAPEARLSDDISRVLTAFADREVTLREIILLMQQRAYAFLLLLIALPFATPIPLPGLSTPFGTIIAFLGLRIACGQKPWLPERLLALKLPSTWLQDLFRTVQRPVRFIERFLRPTLTGLVDAAVPHRLHGLMILVCGLLLLLPLPIPFTNMFPATAVVLLACALLERDGRFSIAGAIVFAAALAYFGLLWMGGTAVVTHFFERLSG